MSKLVIVESPEKGKPIQKFLGKGYKVMASKGHIRDLPKGSLAVDVDNGFTPEYTNMPEKKELIKSLKEAAADSEMVYLATDPDREGEAISWHLAQALDLDADRTARVTFNEITRHGVETGMAHPRAIDQDLVDAQQTRRILDRLVGYKLSPFLWRKVRKGLSAGRVQSVVVRLIVDREREISAFVPEEYWSIEALLEKAGDGQFKARFFGKDGKEIKLTDKAAADVILKRVKAGSFRVTSVKSGTRSKKPAPPFSTATLQQEAAKRLGMRSARTMQIAQKLYEGVELGEQGTVGLITYMRTDSLRIADEAAEAAETYIKEAFGDKFLPPKRRVYKKAKNAQDAHEAVRPTMPALSPDRVKAFVAPEEYKLYKLIWDRFMASQMADCVFRTVSVELDAAGYTFRAAGSTIKFPGFTALYGSEDEEIEVATAVLAALKEGDEPTLLDLAGQQHFTQPPARYNEATLIQAMEEDGIGRPSTYAPIISTIILRKYVEREGRNFKPTQLGEAVTDLLTAQFPKITDVKFTAGMEEKLDEIGGGKIGMVPVLEDFYGDFSATLDNAVKAMEGQRVHIPDPESGELCDKCGKPMVIKTGRFGRFFACSGYPECKNTKPYQMPTAGFCPECGKPMVERESRKGKQFFSCTGYPDCKYMSWDLPIAEKCPQCGTPLFQHNGRGAKIYCAKEGCGYSRPIKGRKDAEASADDTPTETSAPDEK